MLRARASHPPLPLRPAALHCFPSAAQQRLEALTATINELLAKSQALGEQGDVDGAQAAMVEAEQAKVRNGGWGAAAQGGAAGGWAVRGEKQFWAQGGRAGGRRAGGQAV